jgi:hypothetical protein
MTTSLTWPTRECRTGAMRTSENPPYRKVWIRGRTRATTPRPCPPAFSSSSRSRSSSENSLQLAQ